MRLSPNQTDSKTPDCSARTAASRIVSIFVRPKSTPRFGRLTPHRTGKLRIIRTPHLRPKHVKESARAVKEIGETKLLDSLSSIGINVEASDRVVSTTFVTGGQGAWRESDSVREFPHRDR